MSDKFAGGIKAGSTSVSIDIVLRKKTDNTGLTGIAYNTSGNIASYQRQGGTRTAITLATQTVGGAYSSGGFVEVDATNMPGLYRLDIPDAALATGADWVTISMVTTSGFTYYERISLETLGAAELGARIPTALVSGRIDASVGAMAANVLTASAIASDAITNAKIADNAISDGKIATDAITAAKIAADAITEIQSGLATLAALAIVDGIVDAILVDTGTDIPTLINALNNISSGDVQTAANAALVANHLDHLLAATYDPANKPGASDALLNEIIGNDAGVSQFTANALELAPSGGEGLAAEVWSYATRTLTQSAASVVAAVTGSNIAVYRGTTWSITLTGLGNINAYDTIYMSVKDDDKSEADAILRVYNDASGLLWFNGAEAETATNGTITIDDADEGDITITVLEAETQNAPIGFFVYDIKGIDDNGNVDLLSSGGKFQVTADITRAITSP